MGKISISSPADFLSLPPYKNTGYYFHGRSILKVRDRILKKILENHIILIFLTFIWFY